MELLPLINLRKQMEETVEKEVMYILLEILMYMTLLKYLRLKSLRQMMVKEEKKTEKRGKMEMILKFMFLLSQRYSMKMI